MQFPYHSGRKNKKSTEYVRENVKWVLDMLKSPRETHRKGAIRSLLGGISNYFERNEGYTYGQSQGFVDNMHLATKKSYNPNSKFFRVEHSVPLQVVEDYLASSNMSVDEAIVYLREAMHLYLITKEEDKALKPYKYSMPVGCSSNDVMARYNACGIKIVKHWCK